MDEPRLRTLVRIMVGLSLLLSAGLIHALFANSLSPAELRGQSIFRKGEGPSSRPIAAFVGGTEIQARLVPCSSCHGMDGRGRPEGSVVPPSIRWEDLARPQRAGAGSRERVPYNERLLARAITMGFDSSGNRLNAAMPRFALSRADADDLIAYLKKLSLDYDPGLSDVAVRIGALLPPGSRYPGLSAAIQSALTAYFADVNKAGGLYGRRIELICRELPPEPEKVAATYKEFLEKEQVFALLASFIAGAEKQSTEVLQEQKVPLVGAWTLLPQADPSSNSTLFYLDSGLPGQSEALVNFALQEYATNGEKLALVNSDSPLSEAAIQAARSQLEGSPWAAAAEVKGPEDAAGADALVRRLITDKVKVLFLALQESQLVELVHAIKRASWNAILLVPDALYKEVRNWRPFPGRIFLAISSLPSDITREGSSEYQKLQFEYGLSRQHLPAQFTALAEASLLIEGLKRAGHDLSREHLLDSLGSVYEFSTGFTPPVRFGPARHIGITQFHIVTIDPMTGTLAQVNQEQR